MLFACDGWHKPGRMHFCLLVTQEAWTSECLYAVETNIPGPLLVCRLHSIESSGLLVHERHVVQSPKLVVTHLNKYTLLSHVSKEGDDTPTFTKGNRMPPSNTCTELTWLCCWGSSLETPGAIQSLVFRYIWCRYSTDELASRERNRHFCAWVNPKWSTPLMLGKWIALYWSPLLSLGSEGTCKLKFRHNLDINWHCQFENVHE